jgi:hypothetical protein
MIHTYVRTYIHTYACTYRCSSPNDADIYYTIDGNKPTTMRPGVLYAGGGIQIRTDTIIHAIAVSYMDV